jgi:hypothetical protein
VLIYASLAKWPANEFELECNGNICFFRDKICVNNFFYLINLAILFAPTVTFVFISIFLTHKILKGIVKLIEFFTKMSAKTSNSSDHLDNSAVVKNRQNLEKINKIKIF